MIDFVEFANKKVYAPNQEKISWSAEEPYLFSKHWKNNILVISSFGNNPLRYYKELGGKASAYESGAKFGKGIITKPNLKIDLGYYNMSSSKAVFKNTVYGANILLPYFDGASEYNIYRMLNAFPVYVYFRTINYHKLIACDFKDLAVVTENVIMGNGWFKKFEPIKRRNLKGDVIVCFNSFSEHCDEFDILEYSWDFQ